jgi:alkylhydroperoxidase family enzyme
MSRIQIPDDLVDPWTYVLETFVPNIGSAAIRFSRAVYEHTQLSLREMEAARYRTALINGCRKCQIGRAARDFNTQLRVGDQPLERPMTSRGPVPSEDFYQAVLDWRTSPQFTARERLAIEYAERLGKEPQSFEGDEPFWLSLKTHFSDLELVDLSLSIVSWIAFGRLAHALQIDGTSCMVSDQ